MSTNEFPETYLDLSLRERNLFAITVAVNCSSTQEFAAIASRIRDSQSPVSNRLKFDWIDAGYEMWQRHRWIVEEARAAYGLYRDLGSACGIARGMGYRLCEDFRNDYRNIINSETFRSLYNTLHGKGASSLLRTTFEKHNAEFGRRAHARANYEAQKHSGGAFANYNRQMRVRKSALRKRSSRRKS